MIPEPIRPEPITTTLDIGASTWELVDKHFLFKTASGSLVANEGLRMEAMIQVFYRITGIYVRWQKQLEHSKNTVF